MRGINKVTLVGNSGKETEYKVLQDGTPVARLTVATTEIFRLKSGETSAKTEWHPVILWRGLATLANAYVKKGSLLYIEGKLTHRQYETSDGQKKHLTEIIADQILLLDKKEKTGIKEETEDYNEEVPF